MAGIKNAYEKEEYFTPSFDMTSLAAEVIERANKNNQAICQDEEQVKHMISDDLEDSLPPQVYKMIGEIIDLIGALDE